MPIQSKNPATEEILQTFEPHSDEAVEEKISTAQKRFELWRKTSFAERKKLMLNLAQAFIDQKQELAKIMTLEMGKPIKQSIAEVEKCAWCCEHYAEKAEEYLSLEEIETDASESYVQFDPIGIVLAVMPWNFPYWQVVRFIAPAAMAGNVGLLKHASNVPQCALKLEELFLTAGFPEGVFQTLLIGSNKVDDVLADPRIKAATLTGSESAGSAVAKKCGELIKKTVLELGGSNAHIICADADLDLALEQAERGRFQNTGQSCIAAKRFIVMDAVYDEFVQRFVNRTNEMKIGDPLEEDTELGPLVNQKALDALLKMIEYSVAKGAKVLTGGKRWGHQGYFLEPTIVENIEKGMPLYDDETFGPVASIWRAHSWEEAIELANDTPFALGVSIFTADTKLAKNAASEFDDGAVFVNGIVKSDPRLPFGGTGISGYGRELSHYGIKEFVNIKTVWVQ